MFLSVFSSSAPLVRFPRKIFFNFLNFRLINNFHTPYSIESMYLEEECIEHWNEDKRDERTDEETAHDGYGK